MVLTEFLPVRFYIGCHLVQTTWGAAPEGEVVRKLEERRRVMEGLTISRTSRPRDPFTARDRILKTFKYQGSTLCDDGDVLCNRK